MLFCLICKQRGPDERMQMRKLVLGEGAAAASVQAACLSAPVRSVATARDGRCVAWQVSRVQKMLGDEFGTASNIKSRVNRQSVLGAITSCQQRLKLYNRVRHFAAQIAMSAIGTFGRHARIGTSMLMYAVVHSVIDIHTIIQGPVHGRCKACDAMSWR